MLSIEDSRAIDERVEFPADTEQRPRLGTHHPRPVIRLVEAPAEETQDETQGETQKVPADELAAAQARIGELETQLREAQAELQRLRERTGEDLVDSAEFARLSAELQVANQEIELYRHSWEVRGGGGQDEPSRWRFWKR